MLPPRPGDLLDLGHLPSWDAALGYLLARAREEPLLVVLDEFPYLCEADPSLPSTLQARWDHRGESQLSLVLAGSPRRAHGAARRRGRAAVRPR